MVEQLKVNDAEIEKKVFHCSKKVVNIYNVDFKKNVRIL